MASRPQPPRELFDIDAGVNFHPAPDLAEWVRDTFIEEAASLANVDHLHLSQANIGMLWTNVPNSRQMKVVVGTAEAGLPRAFGKWAKARAEQQLTEWFGDVPDFLITLDAGYAAQCDDAAFCALLEHELYHCGQELDAFGQPKFRADGRPAYAMRGHDVEELIGVVRRYGVGVAAGGVHELVEAAKHRPEIAQAEIQGVCGTCFLRAA